MVRFSASLNSRGRWDLATGQHRLRLTAGSKSGEDQYYLDVREGNKKAPEGRCWDVQVRPATEDPPVVPATAERVELPASDGDRVIAYLAGHPDGQARTAIATGAGVSRRKIEGVMSDLVDRQLIEACEVIDSHRPTRKHPGFRLAQSAEK